MKNTHDSIRKMLTLCSIAAMGIGLSIPVSASGLQSSELYTGTSKLVSDITLVLTVLCPTICGLFAIYFAIRRGMADEQDGKLWTRRITTAIICGVAGGLISGIISLIASYYA